MDEEKIRAQIGANISMYRKKLGWTQMGLAERINYSDKAVSKWERGESIPDVVTMMLLAKEFGITLNDLTAVTVETPEKSITKKADHNIILRLTNILVWFVALFVFVVLASFKYHFCWVPFVFAVPVTSIVQLSLRSAWRDFRYNPLLISLIAWGSLASIFVTLMYVLQIKIWLIFLLGIPGQIAILLWFRMYIPIESETNESPVDNHE